MKKIFVAFAASLAIISCKQKTEEVQTENQEFVMADYELFGSEISPDGAISPEEMLKMYESMETGDSIEVTLKSDGDRNTALLTVADQGVGIANEEKRRIFDKFYRIGREETRKTKGTGLGLYIVKTVLEKHDAQIKVKDNIPAGTVFEVILKKYAS